LKKLKVAVIGCGNIAKGAHIENYANNQNVELTYFCDIIPERADEQVKLHGGTAVYDYKQLLDKPDIDAVSVCTHNNTHAPISIDFMRAGKDVLCEKPAARTLAEALEMQRVAKETGRLLIIGVVNRFGAYNNLVKQMIGNGDLGEVYQVYCSFRDHRAIPGIGGDFTNKAISGGGTLIDWGVHYIDLALYCCGEPKALTVSGQAFCKLGRDIQNYTYLKMWADRTKNLNGVYDVDDSVTGVVRTTGPTITFNGAWAKNIGEKESFIDFLGDKGGIRLNYCNDFVYYTAQDGGLTQRKIELPDNNFYKAEIDAFVDCVITRVPNQGEINRTIEASKIIDGLYRSSEEKKEVVIDA